MTTPQRPFLGFAVLLTIMTYPDDPTLFKSFTEVRHYSGQILLLRVNFMPLIKRTHKQLLDMYPHVYKVKRNRKCLLWL